MRTTQVRFGRTRGAGALWPFAVVALVVASAACGSNEPTANPISTPPPVGGGGAAGSSGMQGGGGGGNGGAGGVDCYMNPKTHHEIINACTNAVRVKKTPNLKGLKADGSLPPPQ